MKIILSFFLYICITGCEKIDNYKNRERSVSFTVDSTNYTLTAWATLEHVKNCYTMIIETPSNEITLLLTLYKYNLKMVQQDTFSVFTNSTTLTNDAFMTVSYKSGDLISEFFASRNELEIKTGEVIISELDTINQTISGTFSGRLFNMKNTKDSIMVTNGILRKIPFEIISSK